MILLLGAGGQLGRELAAAAKQAGRPLTGLTRDQLDITDRGAVVDAVARFNPTLLINAAAYTRVDEAESEADAAWRINAAGPQILAEAAAAAEVPLVHFSTDYVFDGSKPTAYTEDDPIAPLGVYGSSKAEGEAAVRRIAPRHLILRTAWLFSSHGHNLARTILRLANEQDELRVVADRHGSPTAAADLAAAVIAAVPMLTEPVAAFGTYHLVNGGTTSWFGLAERLVAAAAKVSGRSPRLVPIATADYPTAARRPANSVLDSSRFADAFGIRLPAWQDAADRVAKDIVATGTFA